MNAMMAAAKEQAAQMTPEQKAALVAQARKAAQDAAKAQGLGDDVAKQAGDAAEALVKQTLGIQ
ncbi:MAG TPA: hypothetical protein VGM83_18980 [Devosiaceae bacterium]|jgi:hypothetical protein